jgi:hypothetical protein
MIRPGKLSVFALFIGLLSPVQGAELEAHLGSNLIKFCRVLLGHMAHARKPQNEAEATAARARADAMKAMLAQETRLLNLLVSNTISDDAWLNIALENPGFNDIEWLRTNWVATRAPLIELNRKLNEIDRRRRDVSGRVVTPQIGLLEMRAILEARAVFITAPFRIPGVEIDHTLSSLMSFCYLIGDPRISSKSLGTWAEATGAYLVGPNHDAQTFVRGVQELNAAKALLRIILLEAEIFFSRERPFFSGEVLGPSFDFVVRKRGSASIEMLAEVKQLDSLERAVELNEAIRQTLRKLTPSRPDGAAAVSGSRAKLDDQDLYEIVDQSQALQDESVPKMLIIQAPWPLADLVSKRGFEIRRVYKNGDRILEYTDSAGKILKSKRWNLLDDATKAFAEVKGNEKLSMIMLTTPDGIPVAIFGNPGKPGPWKILHRSRWMNEPELR